MNQHELNSKIEALIRQRDDSKASYIKEVQCMKTLTESVPRDDSLPRREEFRAEINQEKSALQMEESSAVQRAMEFAKLNYMLDSKTRLSPSDPVDDMDNEYPDQEADVDLEILELEAQALQVELELLDF